MRPMWTGPVSACDVCHPLGVPSEHPSHARRYTSFGRHFTKTELLEKLSTELVKFIDNGDTIVDFSCGANEWVPMMKALCRGHGVMLSGKSFDIITPIDCQDFVKKSWFEVQPGGASVFD